MIDILIPGSDLPDMTIECIDSIRKNTNVDYRIVYIDNGSKEENFKKVRDKLTDKDFYIRNKKNLGFPRAINQGLYVSDNDVVILNNDALVSRNWLTKLQKTGVGIVAPILNDSPSSGWQTEKKLNKLFNLEYPTYKGGLNKYNELIEKLYGGQYKVIDYHMIAFICAYIKRKVLKDVGMLSTEYGYGYFDDDDWCIRAQRRGHKIALALDTLVEHKVSETFKSKFTQKQLKGMMKRNHSRFDRKYIKNRILLALLSNRPYDTGETFPNVLDILSTTSKEYRTDYCRFESIDITSMRNMACKYAVENEYDYIFMIDDDMLFPPDCIIKLIQDDKDIVVGTAKQRIPPFLPTQYKEFLDKGFKAKTNRVHFKKEDIELTQIGASGLVGALITTNLLKKMEYPYFKQMYNKEAIDIGEDIYFCKKLNEMNIPLWCDPTVDYSHRIKAYVNRNGVIVQDALERINLVRIS